MEFSQLLRWSFRQIRTRFLESLLIIIAIGIGVAVIAGVGTLFIAGSREFNLTHPEQNIVTLEAKEDDYSFISHSSSQTPVIPLGLANAKKVALTPALIAELKDAIPEINEILAYEYHGSRLKGAPRPENEAFSFRRDDPYSIDLIWGLPNIISFLGAEIEQGDLYTIEDFLNNKNFAVIGHDVAERLFPEQNPLGQLIEFEYNDSYLTVIGVLKEIPKEEPQFHSQFFWLRQELNNRVFTSVNIYQTEAKAFRELTLIPKSTNTKFAAIVRDYITAQYGDSLTVKSSREERQKELELAKPMLIFIGSLSSLALFIAALNILNLMLARVLKRTRSIGITKALGSSRKNIFWQYLLESLTLGLSGGILGLLLIMLASPLLASFMGGSSTITSGTAFLSLGFAFLVSLLFGIYPAIKAASINPSSALKLE